MVLRTVTAVVLLTQCSSFTNDMLWDRSYREMGHNQLSWTVGDMDGVFEGLVSLSRLGLISNNIKLISNGAFLGLEHLRHLLLTDNAISSIQENAFALLSQLEELQLNSTNLLCDCQLSWLPIWLRSAGFAASVKATCAHPESLKGRSIFDVKKQNFTCISSELALIISSLLSDLFCGNRCYVQI